MWLALAILCMTWMAFYCAGHRSSRPQQTATASQLSFGIMVAWKGAYGIAAWALLPV